MRSNFYPCAHVYTILPPSERNNFDWSLKCICSVFIMQTSDQFSSVGQSSPTLCDPMNCSIPGFPVLHYLPDFAQTHVHWVMVLSSHLILCCPSSTFHLFWVFVCNSFFSSFLAMFSIDWAMCFSLFNLKNVYGLEVVSFISLY